MTPGGSRFSASAAEVTVPVVTKTLKARALMRAISGMAATSSPTLAPANHPHPPPRIARPAPSAPPVRHPLRRLLAATHTALEQQLGERRRRRLQQLIGE